MCLRSGGSAVRRFGVCLKPLRAGRCALEEHDDQVVHLYPTDNSLGPKIRYNPLVSPPAPDFRAPSTMPGNLLPSLAVPASALGAVSLMVHALP